jgi:hypothetical protein
MKEPDSIGNRDSRTSKNALHKQELAEAKTKGGN